MHTIIRLPAKLLLGAFALITFSEIGYAQESAAVASPVVVELFQSQGCSSCPPAEANLNAIAGQPNILALSFAVTYWDDLGWKDTFASEAFTDRQYDYAHFQRRHYQKHNGVYTPQVIVNGRTAIVGSDRMEFDQVIAQAQAPQGPSLSWAKSQLRVGDGQPAAPADVWLVRYDPRTIEVAIGAGENGGRTLPHRNVVRELLNLGSWDGSAKTFTVPAASSGGLSTAALVQVHGGGAILAASKEADMSQNVASR